MDAKALPVAAADLTSLLSLGPLRRIGDWPLEAACHLRMSGRDSLWIGLGYPGARAPIDYAALWRLVHPGARIAAGYEVRPLMNVDQARRARAQFVRLDLVSMHSTRTSDGAYVLTGVQHAATDA